MWSIIIRSNREFLTFFKRGHFGSNPIFFAESKMAGRGMGIGGREGKMGGGRRLNDLNSKIEGLHYKDRIRLG